MNFRILCFIKILQPPLGWQNLNRTIAYTRFHRIEGGSGVATPSPTTLIEWMKFKDFMNPALCHAGSRIHTISSTLSKVIVIGGGGCTPCMAYMQLLKWFSLMKEIVMCNNNLRLKSPLTRSTDH